MLRIWLNHDGFFISILFRMFLGITFLFMISKVNIKIVQASIWLNHDGFFMSIVFRIVSSLNHFKLPLFMISKVNETFLRQFLGLYSLLMLRIWLNHDGFFMSILFRIVSSLDHFQLPLFMISKVNETILRQFLGLYCLLMLRTWLNHDAFFMSMYLGLFLA